MDNILIQVTGNKKVVLFEPEEVEYLYLKGDKSQVLDIDNPDLDKYPLFSKVKRYECLLESGDILFIPALWFHNVIALDFSVAINVFWRHLDDYFYDKKDLYGNKDLNPALKSFEWTQKSLKELKTLPEPYRTFYIKRLIDTLKENLK
jgi:tRNA wybutosine-synthesizing protein 5